MPETTEFSNPFEYDAAKNLAVNDLIDIFVEDHNFSRFICAPRNVFLVGERGSGKSMTLRYNSFPVKAEFGAQFEGKVNTEYVGILIECNSPLYARKDDDFAGADEFVSRLLSEHLFVADIGQAIIEALEAAADLLTEDECEEVLDALSIYYGVELSTYGSTFFDRIRRYFRRMSVQAQKSLNNLNWETINHDYITFSSAILPFLEELQRTNAYKDSHFMFMVDDAQNLSIYQRQILNSWIAYRSQSMFSFQVGAAKSEYKDFFTISGGPILEGHDFITLDMEQSFQNPNSDFAIFSRKVIAKRLKKLSNFNCESMGDESQSALKFFPESEQLNEELKKCREEVETEYKSENPNASDKQIRDWGYKYGRVKFFRERHPKANLPSYSGFDTIAHISTGVIRGLLEPCYYMFEAAESKSEGKPVDFISPEIQSNVLRSRSDDAWTKVSELHKHIRECTEDDAGKIYKLLESLGAYFTARLMTHRSEPRILAFTISAKDQISRIEQKNLHRLLTICRAARLIYVRRGVSRDKARRENYFVPDRLLWPSLGLDPIGQHGRASIKAVNIIGAINGVKIPTDWEDVSSDGAQNLELDFLE